MSQSRKERYRVSPSAASPVEFYAEGGGVTNLSRLRCLFEILVAYEQEEYCFDSRQKGRGDDDRCGLKRNGRTKKKKTTRL